MNKSLIYLILLSCMIKNILNSECTDAQKAVKICTSITGVDNPENKCIEETGENCVEAPKTCADYKKADITCTTITQVESGNKCIEVTGENCVESPKTCADYKKIEITCSTNFKYSQEINGLKGRR